MEATIGGHTKREWEIASDNYGAWVGLEGILVWVGHENIGCFELFCEILGNCDLIVIATWTRNEREEDGDEENDVRKQLGSTMI